MAIIDFRYMSIDMIFDNSTLANVYEINSKIINNPAFLRAYGEFLTKSTFRKWEYDFSGLDGDLKKITSEVKDPTSCSARSFNIYGPNRVEFIVYDQHKEQKSISMKNTDIKLDEDGNLIIDETVRLYVVLPLNTKVDSSIKFSRKSYDSFGVLRSHRNLSVSHNGKIDFDSEISDIDEFAMAVSSEVPFENLVDLDLSKGYRLRVNSFELKRDPQYVEIADFVGFQKGNIVRKRIALHMPRQVVPTANFYGLVTPTCSEFIDETDNLMSSEELEQMILKGQFIVPGEYPSTIQGMQKLAGPRLGKRI